MSIRTTAVHTTYRTTYTSGHLSLVPPLAPRRTVQARLQPVPALPAQPTGRTLAQLKQQHLSAVTPADFARLQRLLNARTRIS